MMLFGSAEEYQLLSLYRQFSEAYDAVGFADPTPERVAAFRRWLQNEPRRDLSRYEERFLAEYWGQELNPATGSMTP